MRSFSSKFGFSFAAGVFLASAAMAVAATPEVNSDGPAPVVMHLRAPATAVTAAAGPAVTSSAASAASGPDANAPSTLPDAPSAPAAATVTEPTLPAFMQSQNLPRPGTQNKKAYADDASHRSRYRNVLDEGETVPPLGVSGKLILSMRESVAPFTIIGTVAAAGINHLDQGDPQFGEGTQAFGQRVGAAFALESSGNILSDGILASAFHEDPRYYRQPDASFGVRAFHPIESVFITRTDSGHKTPNFSALLGLAGAAFLTQAYYPPRSDNTTTSLNTFGYSLAGLAAADMVSEFFPDILHKFHHPQD